MKKKWKKKRIFLDIQLRLCKHASYSSTSNKGPASFQTPNFVNTEWKLPLTLTIKLIKRRSVHDRECIALRSCPPLVWEVRLRPNCCTGLCKYGRTGGDKANCTALPAWIILRWEKIISCGVPTSRSDLGPLSRALAATSSRTLWSCRAAETISHHWVFLQHHREKSHVLGCTTGSLLQWLWQK